MRNLILLCGLSLLATLVVTFWPFGSTDSPPPAAPDSTLTNPGESATVARADSVEPTPVAVGRAAVSEATAVAPKRSKVFPAERPLGVLSGQVVDGNKLPVPNADVEIVADLIRLPVGHALRDDRGVHRTLRAATDGRFQAKDLPAGPYVVSARTEDGRRGRETLAIRGQGTAEFVKVAVLPPAAGADFTVVVVDSKDQPVAGARIEIAAGQSGQGLFGMDGIPALAGTADETGRCTFVDRKLEGAIVTAFATDGRVGRASLFRHDAVEEAMAQGGVKVIVDNPGRIEGQLNGTPSARLRGARVQAHTLNTEIPYTMVTYDVAVETAVAGNQFAFDGLPAGTYTLTLHGTDLRLVLARWNDDGEEHDNSITPATVTVVAGQTATCQLAVTPGGSIAGRVVTAGGAPVADAEVTASFYPPNATFVDTHIVRGLSPIYMQNDARAFRRNPATNPRTRTGADGRYLLAGLQSGSHRIELQAEGFATDRRLDVLVRDGQTTELVHLAEPAGVLQGIAPGGMTLVLTRRGKVQPHALVELPDSGLFTLPGLPADHYDVALAEDNDGSDRLLTAIEIAAGRTTWVDLVTAGGDLIAAVVRDDRGPIAGVSIRGYGQTKHTAADGAFSLRVPPNREIGLSVEADNLEWQVVLPPKPPGLTNWPGELRLGMHEVQVSIQDPDGAPLAIDFTLHGSSQEAHAVGTFELQQSALRTADTGEARVTHLFAGSYVVAASFPDGSSADVSFEVPRLQPVVLRAPQTGTVIVQVQDASSNPRRGIWVQFEPVRVEAAAEAQGPQEHLVLNELLENREIEALPGRGVFELGGSAHVALGRNHAYQWISAMADGEIFVGHEGSRQARTDRTGRAVFTGVPAGEVTLSLRLPRELRGDPPPPAAQAWPAAQRAHAYYKGSTNVEFRVPVYGK